MKTISPVSIWQNGQNVQAIYLKAEVQADNLINYASFAYMLLDADFLNVNNGLVGISGKDYIDYQTNQYAWDWIASSLKLTIIGDYVSPVTIVEEPIKEPIEQKPSIAETPIIENPIVETIVESPTAEIITE